MIGREISERWAKEPRASFCLRERCSGRLVGIFEESVFDVVESRWWRLAVASGAYCRHFVRSSAVGSKARYSYKIALERKLADERYYQDCGEGERNQH